MAEVLQLAKTTARVPEPGGFVLTETAQDILRSLREIHVGEGALFTMIAGIPGIGKTMAVRRFAEVEDRVTVVRFMRGEDRLSDVSETLFRHVLHWENANGKSIPLRREMIVSIIRDHERTIVADEAQHIGPNGLEWLRGVAEDAGVSVAFVGDTNLSPIVRGLGQLASRMELPLELGTERPTRGDVKALAAVEGIGGASAVKRLADAARQIGGLRNVSRVLKCARKFAGDAPIDDAHIDAAINACGLASRREI